MALDGNCAHGTARHTSAPNCLAYTGNDIKGKRKWQMEN